MSIPPHGWESNSLTLMVIETDGTCKSTYHVIMDTRKKYQWEEHFGLKPDFVLNLAIFV
jgi:hypothetical protein